MISFYDDFSMTIGGKAARSPQTIEIVNPASEEVIARLLCLVGDRGREAGDTRQGKQGHAPWRR
ncbi:hypothetical protein F1C10_11470 [Sphingomonas sp. NBWT7]|uniref:hypothetical protein n=1 Tax=Sphingomonas sp. NBWT7 TaxID=2596913 RepID=UPI0016261FA7|nr:hypothetical protein [Sphingomonas sp. NBWT7]QNE32504.1 hypothetical protein F1C10_11470 [Sphingomonas sp. NBWT7]